MQFVYPLFLLGALSLAIPIILHLFYFRRFKKVYFTNVRFLREVKEETSARSRLRNLLALLMRLLALLALTLAFAQPFFPGNSSQPQGVRAVSIYLDNSFSMSSLSKDVPLLEQGRTRAREIVRSFSPDDQFQVITNDFSGRQQRLLSQADALTAIDAIQIGPDSRRLTQVLERQKQALTNSRSAHHIVYQISDFQRSIADIQGFSDSTMELNLLPLRAVQERNVSIDSIWFDAPVQMLNQTNPVFVRIRNHGKETAENIRLSLDFDGQTKPVGVLSIPPGSTITDTLNMTILKTGWQEATLSLTDYPVQFDDHYYFSFPVAERIKTLLIQEGTTNQYLQTAIQGFPRFELQTQSSQQLNYSRFSDYQLIILADLTSYSTGLADELQRYIRQGGNVLLFPGPVDNPANLQAFLKTFPTDLPTGFEKSSRQVSELNAEAFVFKDVFERKPDNIRLPLATGSYRLARSTAGAEPLLTFRDGSAFLSAYSFDKGHFYLCAAPLAETYSNLVQSGEIFIPMLYRMAVSSGNVQRLAYTIGQDEQLEAQRQGTESEKAYTLKGQQGEFIPEQRLAGNAIFLGVNDQIKEAGHYRLYLTPGQTLHTFSFNFDRKESNPECVDAGELSDRAGAQARVMETANETVLAAKIQEQGKGAALWKWGILLALLFLLSEILILRFWK